jgi:hypothetical protein
MCTVVARNYLAHARVLARSFLEHHPDASVHVLVLDADADAADSSLGDELFTVVRPEEVVPADDFRTMRAMYDVLELATAVKPWLLRSLLDRYRAPVCYVDPDIEVFSPLVEATESAQSVPLVLTPHLTAPMARDGRTPDEDFILKSGVFNLGFVAVGKGAEPFLDWWAERLRTECIVAPERQRFVDQRWIDLAAGIFPHDIVRHPGYNVAYWNIGLRRVTGTRASGYLVDETPLRFFHFSGFEMEDRSRLSKHQGAAPRHELAQDATAIDLVTHYSKTLKDAGYHEASATPYGFARLADGTILDRPRRRAYREGVLQHERHGSPPPPDPFEDPAAFRRWYAAADVPAAGGWRYTDRWSPHYPEELEHLLMAIANRPVARRAVSRLSRSLWGTARWSRDRGRGGNKT